MAAAQSTKSGVVIPRRLSWKRGIAASGVALLFRLSIKSWRMKWKAEANRAGVKAPVIFCIWHNHLALALASYDVYAQTRWQEKGLVAMVSASGDGAFLAAVLGKFCVNTIRGSSSRRGPQALLEATRWLKKGYSIAITPDGPRGPAHKIQEGIIYLAQVSGRPIVPISNFAHSKICLRSWDRFQIPLPFARCDLYDNEPIFVPRDATEAQCQELRAKLEAAMGAITHD